VAEHCPGFEEQMREVSRAIEEIGVVGENPISTYWPRERRDSSRSCDYRGRDNGSRQLDPVEDFQLGKKPTQEVGIKTTYVTKSDGYKVD
jgi:hypothetical protein